MIFISSSFIDKIRIGVMKMEELFFFNDFVFESLQKTFDAGITDHPFKFFKDSFTKS